MSFAVPVTSFAIAMPTQERFAPAFRLASFVNQRKRSMYKNETISINHLPRALWDCPVGLGSFHGPRRMFGDHGGIPRAGASSTVQTTCCPSTAVTAPDSPRRRQTQSRHRRSLPRRRRRCKPSSTNSINSIRRTCGRCNRWSRPAWRI